MLLSIINYLPNEGIERQPQTTHNGRTQSFAWFALQAARTHEISGAVSQRPLEAL